MPGAQCLKYDVLKDSCQCKLFGGKTSMDTSTQPNATPNAVSSCTTPLTSLCVSKSTISEGEIASQSPSLEAHSIQSTLNSYESTTGLNSNNAIVESQLPENDNSHSLCSPLDRNNYSSTVGDFALTQNQLEAHSISTYLCVCTCCHSTVLQHLCVLFRVYNYDFNNPVVSQALSKQIRYRHHGTPEYICKECHHALRKNKKFNIVPLMPHNAIASPFKWKSSSLSDTSDHLTVHCKAGTSSKTCVHPNITISLQETDVPTKSNSTIAKQTSGCQSHISTVQQSPSRLNTSEPVIAVNSSFAASDESTENVLPATSNSDTLHVCTCCHNTFKT